MRSPDDLSRHLRWDCAPTRARSRRHSDRFTFHTPVKHAAAGPDGTLAFMHPRDEGIVVGLLIGEGYFGGDGRQPQVTLRMHVRHEALLRWLSSASRARASTGRTTTAGATTSSGWRAARRWWRTCCRCSSAHITPDLDAHAHERLTTMTGRYADAIGERGARATALAA